MVLPDLTGFEGPLSAQDSERYYSDISVAMSATRAANEGGGRAAAAAAAVAAGAGSNGTLTTYDRSSNGTMQNIDRSGAREGPGGGGGGSGGVNGIGGANGRNGPNVVGLWTPPVEVLRLLVHRGMFAEARAYSKSELLGLRYASDEICVMRTG